MVDSKYHTGISLDNILRPVVESLTADEQKQYEDLMHQAKENFLSQFTVDRHQKVVKHGEIEVAYLLPSLQISNVSKPDNIQSIKQCVDQQQDQMKQKIGGLEINFKINKFVGKIYCS
jgi:accessory colonization factor AcfC